MIRDWEGNRLSASQKRAIITGKIGVIDERLRELRKVRRYLDEKLSLVTAGGSRVQPTKLEKSVTRKRLSTGKVNSKRTT